MEWRQETLRVRGEVADTVEAEGISTYWAGSPLTPNAPSKRDAERALESGPPRPAGTSLGSVARLRCLPRSMWRTFADGVGDVFDFVAITSVSRRGSRPSAWENLEQRLAEKYVRLERDGNPDVSNSRGDLSPGDSNDGRVER